MTDKTYNTIRTLAEIAVPILALIASLCTIWNVPHAEAICASLTALDTAIGAVVMILRNNYNKKQNS